MQAIPNHVVDHPPIVLEVVVFFTPLLSFNYWLRKQPLSYIHDTINSVAIKAFSNGAKLWGALNLITLAGVEYIQWQENHSRYSPLFLRLRILVVIANCLIMPIIIKCTRKFSTFQLEFPLRIACHNVLYYVIIFCSHPSVQQSIMDFMDTPTPGIVEQRNNAIALKSSRKSLNEEPYTYLNKLHQALRNKYLLAKRTKKSSQLFDLRTTLINEEGRNEGGQDAGGLSREWMDILFKAISQQRKHFQTLEDSSSLVIPRLPHNLPENRGTTIVELTNLYKQLGETMMLLYHNITMETRHQFICLIGQHFEASTFSAFALTSKELNTSYSELPITTKAKLALCMLNQEQGKHLSEVYNNYQDLCKYVKDYDGQTNTLSKDKVEEIDKLLEYYFSISILDDTDPAWQGYSSLSEQDKKQKRAACLHLCFSRSIGSEERLLPLHAIGQGMKNCAIPPATSESSLDHYWDRKFGLKTFITQFSTTLQGVLNREHIIQCLTPNAPNLSSTAQFHFTNKITWLKQWIKDDATEEELKQFLKFVTGTTSLPLSDRGDTAKIWVKIVEDRHPFPHVSTCTKTIYLSKHTSTVLENSDTTKDGFIQCVKYAMENAGGSFTLA